MSGIKGNGRPKGIRISKTCVICGVRYLVAPHMVKRRKTCGSKNCRHLINCGKYCYWWKGGINSIKKHCVDCGKEIVRKDAKRCKKCYGKSKLGISIKSALEKRLTIRENNRKRKLKLKNIVGSHTFSEWEKLKAYYNHVCLDCRKREPEVKLTRDHMVPIEDNGTDFIDNIQPLCGSCNSRKHTKTINYRKDFIYV